MNEQCYHCGEKDGSFLTVINDWRRKLDNYTPNYDICAKRVCRACFDSWQRCFKKWNDECAERKKTYCDRCNNKITNHVITFSTIVIKNISYSILICESCSESMGELFEKNNHDYAKDVTLLFQTAMMDFLEHRILGIYIGNE